MHVFVVYICKEIFILNHRWRADCCADSLEGCNFFCCNCYGCDYHSCRKSRNNLFNAISKKAPVYENPAQKIMKGLILNFNKLLI